MSPRPVGGLLGSIVFVSLLGGCGARAARVVNAHAAELLDLSWMTLGPWQTDVDSAGCLSVETWQRVDDTHLSGQSIALCAGQGTVARPSEEFTLEERAEGIYYLTPREGREPTELRLTDVDATHFVADNPARDFPARISYRLIDEAHIESIVCGHGRCLTRRMTRRADWLDPD